MISARHLVFTSMVLLMMPAAWAAPSVQQWEGNHLGSPTKHKPMRSIAQRSISKSVRALSAVIPVSPVLTGLNYGMAPPGATVTIAGSNFSPNWKDNQVFFNNVPAQITGSSQNAISVIVPDWTYGSSQLGIAVRVVSHGVPSANSLKFDIGAKYLTPDQL
ncbi:MAG TPA: IPT/TIG domain-containing protein [Candidatus Obscuribacterales bacterium]